MYSLALLRPMIYKGFSCLCIISRTLCSRTSNSDDVENGYGRIEDFLEESWKSSSIELNEEKISDSNSLDNWGTNGSYQYQRNFSAKKDFVDQMKVDSARILEILYQNSPEFDARRHLSSLGLRISSVLVREVLHGILKMVNEVNKKRCAELSYKFFVWSGEQKNYKHTTYVYHIMLKILAESKEFVAMWRLVDEMIVNGYPTTARTFNLLICSCCGAGLAKKVVVRFMKSKNFNYRPFKHSFNAILHSLLTINHYNLIEWVYRKMLFEGHSPDVLTYNIILSAKFRLGKLDHFHELFDEMRRNGFLPDFHTFNLLLHVLGKGDNPLAAMNLLNHMKEIGVYPSILHFTTLIDGLSRAGNLDACHFFFNEMINHGFTPDVVCYTVMITGYVVAGEFDKARVMFNEMIQKGQLPNVFTYNSMIRGLCMEGKFEEACCILKEMESRGCKPNFLVYTTLVGYLRNAGRLRDAHEVIKHMMEKGKYTHLLPKIKRFRR